MSGRRSSEPEVVAGAAVYETTAGDAVPAVSGAEELAAPRMAARLANRLGLSGTVYHGPTPARIPTLPSLT